MEHRIILKISDEELRARIEENQFSRADYNLARLSVIRDFGSVEDSDWLSKIEQAENAHALGFEAGYSAAIHDARIEGSRAYAELHDGR